MCFIFLLDGNGPVPRMGERGTRALPFGFTVVLNYSRTCFCYVSVPFHTVSVCHKRFGHTNEVQIFEILAFGMPYSNLGEYMDYEAHVCLKWYNIAMDPQQDIVFHLFPIGQRASFRREVAKSTRLWDTCREWWSCERISCDSIHLVYFGAKLTQNMAIFSGKK